MTTSLRTTLKHALRETNGQREMVEVKAQLAAPDLKKQTNAASEPKLTLGSLTAFYAPIAVSFFLTIITHSLFNAGLARLP